MTYKLNNDLQDTITYRRIFSIVIPTILANITVPLVGIVDLAIIGRFDDPALIAAISAGGAIISLIFWAFGFLRMGITGPLGQRLEASSQAPAQLLIRRYLHIAVIGGVLLWLMGNLILPWIVAWFDNGDPAFLQALNAYIEIRLWSAPFSLMNYVLLGVVLALARGRLLLTLQLVLNISNMLLSWYFGYYLEYRLVGVAYGSVLSELITVVVGLWLVHRHIPILNRTLLSTRGTADVQDSWWAIIRLNGNIMVRSLLLLVSFSWFAQVGALQGTLLAAVNGVLLKFVEFAAFALDGFAFAVESLAARAIGRKDKRLFDQILQKTLIASSVTGVLLAAVIYAYAGSLGRLITSDPQVIEGVRLYSPWVMAMVVAGIFAYLIDGVFLSAAEGDGLRIGMIWSFVGFAIMILTLPNFYGNAGLWAALLGMMLLRSVTLYMQRARLLAHFD